MSLRSRNLANKNVHRGGPLTLQEAIDRAYQNMCLLLKKEGTNISVPEEFRYFCGEDLMRHFLFDIVLYTHELVKLLDDEQKTNTLFKGLVPGKHELEKQQRIADTLGSTTRARMMDLATSYSQLLLTCSNFEHGIEDLNFFECLYLFTIEVIKMHVRRREWWKAIRQQIAWLLCGATRSLVEYGREDFDAKEEQSKQMSKAIQMRTLDDFMLDGDDAMVNNDTGTDLNATAATHTKKAKRSFLQGGTSFMQSPDARGGPYCSSPGPTDTQHVWLPAVQAKASGGYFFRDEERVERIREAKKSKIMFDQLQGGMLKNMLARRSAGRRAEQGSGPRAMAQKMVQAVKTIENSQKICKSVLDNRAKVRAERARLSPRPRVELQLDKAQNFGTPLISKISPRIQAAMVPTTNGQLVPKYPSNEKPKRLTIRQQRVIDDFKRSRAKGGLLMEESDSK